MLILIVNKDEPKGGNMNSALLAALLKGNLEDFETAATPGGIEKQEAQGQKDFVASESLPRKCPKQELEKLGFVFGETIDGVSGLFVQVKMPKGWKKQATDHSMWSELVDETGKVRASIFYKAAFYDRDAFLRLVD